MYDWQIDFRIAPYSGVKRPAEDVRLIIKDEPLRGAAQTHVIVKACDFAEASKLAEAVTKGIKLDERVWNVTIEGIQMIRDKALPARA